MRAVRALAALLALLAVAGGGIVTSGATFTAGSSAPRNTVQAAADWVGPTVAVADQAQALRGTATIAVSASDSGSGVASVRLERSVADANSWTAVCTTTAAPYGCAIDTTKLTDGLYDFRAIATDNAGYTTTSAVRADVEIDNTTPTVTMDDPGSPLAGVVTLSATADDAQSGVTSVTIQRSPAGLGQWTTVCVNTLAPYTCRFDTTTVALGLYDFRATAVDDAGNTKTSTTIANRRIDNTAPSVSLEDPGAYLRGTVTLTANASAVVGVKSVTIQRAAAGGKTWTDICTDTTAPYTCAWDTTTVAGGQYDLRAVMVTTLNATYTSATVSSRTVDNSATRGIDVQAANAAGGTAGRLGAGDTLTFTYSQQMQPGTLVPGWTGTTPVALYVRALDSKALGGGATTDGLRFSTDANGTQATGLGTVNLGTNGFVFKNKTVTFTATAALSTTTVNGTTATVVTVTLGTPTGTGLKTSTSGTMTWTPSATAKDLAGVAASVAPAPESGAVDTDF